MTHGERVHPVQSINYYNSRAHGHERHDPHMISGTWDGLLVKSLVGLCRSGFTRL
jgi:hypothetical protein